MSRRHPGTHEPGEALIAARLRLRYALKHYRATLLEAVKDRASADAVRDIEANLRASDDAATRAATVAGITAEGDAA